MKIKIILSLLLILSCSYTLSGQKKKAKMTISGTVVNASHVPVEGAVIFIDKVKTNSVTDQEGHYRVKVSPKAQDILVFTLLFGAAEEQINGRETINFILTGHAVDKKEVNTKPADTGNKSTSGTHGVIDGQNQEFASYSNIYDMIRGRFAGVEVTGKSIKIAGSSSLNVSTEPLFVVDGIIVSSIDEISPQTVKSIEVLKGPDASVYGMRGSNGVIVITTLTGKDKK